MNDPRTAVVLFTRDLRLHDNPALATACAGAPYVVPLFVADPAITAGTPRLRFLTGCLIDLRESLRRRGGDLVVRHGDPVTETLRVARSVSAASIIASADVSRYATARQRRLAAACAAERRPLTLTAGVTVVPPGALRPTGGGDHYRVFTPYWRAWQQHRWRAEAAAPRRITLPEGIAGTHPATVLPHTTTGGPTWPPAGESAARRHLDRWADQVTGYGTHRDNLDTGRTSRLSAYLHFGCLSPLSAAIATAGTPEFVRQLCWRDFYHQVLAGYPQLPHRAYRPGVTERWRDDPAALAAWQAGHTGVPIVDAGMRQLAAEGFLPNRARLITAAYLTRQLGLDWRAGAAWYADRLVDADVANNNGNWQWVAGTGTDARPHRRFNPVRQARRFDPDGDYVRRWVPELSHITGPDVHQPAAGTGAGTGATQP